ncbi:MAG: hypothetical protein R3B70_02520 [Polyangiaceae bacterium]
MSWRPLPLACLAILAICAGCGAEAHEDAPPSATAAAIAQAPPNAVGADVPVGPAAPKNEWDDDTAPPPPAHKLPAQPPAHAPDEPIPLPTGAAPAVPPQQGTHL